MSSTTRTDDAGRAAWRRRTAPCASALSAFALLGAGAPAPAEAASPQPIASPKLLPRTCPPDAARLECSVLRVPFDHRDPGGKRIDVAVAVHRARRPGARRGVLLVNPGGPGASGIDFAIGMSTAPPDANIPEPPLLRSILDHFDVVGFDPRGAARSSPVSCGQRDPEILAGFQGIPMRPLLAAERQRSITSARRYAAACDPKTIRRLPFMGTEAVARDMDLLRAALGERSINYYGLSYGTQLGATYAELFLKRIRTMVLDANVDPDSAYSDPLRQTAEQTLAGERVLQAYLASCVRVGVERCPFGAGDPASALDRLVRRLDRTPVTLDADGKRPQPFDNFGLYQVLRGMVASGPAWPELTRVLRGLERGDVTALEEALGIGQESGPAPDGAAPPPPAPRPRGRALPAPPTTSSTPSTRWLARTRSTPTACAPTTRGTGG